MDHSQESIEDESGEKKALTRVLKPKAIMLGFHGSIAPIDWEESVIFPYVESHLLDYLKENYASEPKILPIIERLGQLSFDDHFIYEYAEAPLIVSFSARGNNAEAVLKTVYDYVMWQLRRSKAVPEATHLVKYCWKDGYWKKQLKTIIFADVLPAIQRFKELNIKVGIYSHMEKDVCQLVLSSTTLGDLAQHIDFVLDFKEVGPRRESSSYEKIADKLEVPKKDLLFICHYGQDVKAASDAGLPVLLIFRPGNQRNRTYYLARYRNTESLADIELA